MTIPDIQNQQEGVPGDAKNSKYYKKATHFIVFLD
jgi:hypothetical protein